MLPRTIEARIRIDVCLLDTYASLITQGRVRSDRCLGKRLRRGDETPGNSQIGTTGIEACEVSPHAGKCASLSGTQQKPQSVKVPRARCQPCRALHRCCGTKTQVYNQVSWLLESLQSKQLTKRLRWSCSLSYSAASFSIVSRASTQNYEGVRKHCIQHLRLWPHRSSRLGSKLGSKRTLARKAHSNDSPGHQDHTKRFGQTNALTQQLDRYLRPLLTKSEGR